MDNTAQPKENPHEKKKISSPALEEALSSVHADPVGFVDKVLKESVAMSASDIFFEPREEFLEVRVRIDGVLYVLGSIGLDIYVQVASRFKVLSNLDPTEKRKIQEGQFTIQDYMGATVNLRVEIAQTVNGELIVIRVHKKETIVMELSNLGFSKVAYNNFQNMLKQRSGLILVCGPTGCGKTTTLYSTISTLNENQQYNIMTIEDPVEFKIEGVNQMQVQKEIGFTFAGGLRTILRLSPDVVLVGEIRDKETAEIAVESGLTGQLVLSTLHAEDSVGALFRLLDLGIESYLLNSSLLGIIAQRLVRKACVTCRAPYQPNQDELEIFNKVTGRAPKQLVKSSGCPQCKNIGYKGRMGIFEVMLIDSQVRSLIRSRVNETELRQKLIKANFVTLMRDGFEKAEQGHTTLEEVLRNSLRVT
jgi:type II secretory ATPase GspE/PulE/Tfp pilus assembly ATPase PilB-like protein